MKPCILTKEIKFKLLKFNHKFVCFFKGEVEISSLEFVVFQTFGLSVTAICP